MRNLLWQSDAWKEYESLQAEKLILKKVNKLLKDIMRNGYECSYGKVEMLKGDFSGFASARIDKKNRIIFSVDDNTITVIQWGGYWYTSSCHQRCAALYNCWRHSCQANKKAVLR